MRNPRFFKKVFVVLCILVLASFGWAEDAQEDSVVEDETAPVILLTDSEDSLVDDNDENKCMDWNCRYYASFMIGAEGASMSSIKSDKTVRYEFSSYSQIKKSEWHVYGRLFQSASKTIEPREGESVSASECKDGEGAIVAECEETLTEAVFGEIGVNYFPWQKKNGNEKGNLLMGLTTQYSIHRPDTNVDHFKENIYFGTRFAYSKLQYFDILYDFKHEQVKLKGQVPVMGGKAFAGIEINVVNDDDEEASDSIKAFILYKVDFKKFFE